MDHVILPVLDSAKPSAPANKIEITPEMIAIGVRIIRTYFDQPNDWFTKAIVEELLSEALEYGR